MGSTDKDEVEEAVPPDLRIASLLPSTTEIVGELGLAHCLVAVTHECDVAPDVAGLEAALARGVKRVTASSLDPHGTQREIDTAVRAYVDTMKKADAAGTGPPPLYTVNSALLEELRPTVILTQDLCQVCAVSSRDVLRDCGTLKADVESLAPSTLADVAESIEAVGIACGVPVRGRRARAAFEGRLRAVADALRVAEASVEGMAGAADGTADGTADGAGAMATAVSEEGTADGTVEGAGAMAAGASEERTDSAGTKAAAGAEADVKAATAKASVPTVLLLEWLDPVFDGGHWVPGMVRAAGGTPLLNARDGAKSTTRTWKEVIDADPDVLLVACCGFELERNVADFESALRDARAEGGGGGALAGLRAVRTGRAFALDGNRYFARPSPALALGAALMARCIFADQPAVVAALEALPFLPREGVAWARVGTAAGDAAAAAAAAAVAAAAAEDAGGGAIVADLEDWGVLHEQACARGEQTYIDPKTRLTVFTRVKHEQHGRCCGSGCRHCPFAHANVRDKAAKIQQPAWLHMPERGISDSVIVLLWSGGKDSFLALRALLRGTLAGDTRRVVLLNTFAAATRIVAHQEVKASDIARQATHLDIALVGCPLHPGGTYVERIKAALAVVSGVSHVAGLACGDLHLQHIRAWREETLRGALDGLSIEYPVWSNEPGSNYPELAADLQASGVPCLVSAVADARARDVVGIAVGDAYGPELADKLRGAGLDAFGEDGELHTLACVWDVERARALGLA
ncbi:hypothetical protein FOA52_013427 [Chlamydomonas sp. UWO 241]|nr:hypothetical protein FOA52_013427 [Chlamydomonas sp. UWO 241]